MQVNKDLARRRFSRAARSYNMWSRPQQRMADGLVAMLDPVITPESILELGCGTGLLTKRLQRAYPNTLITALDIAPEMIDECRRRSNGKGRVEYLVADAETFSLEQRFDLIASSSCFQWLTDLDGALRRCAEAMAPSGSLAFAAPALGTLSELWASYSAVAPDKRAGHSLPALAGYLSSVVGAGFAIEAAKEETHSYTCDSPEYVLQHLRGIGATRASLGAGPGLNRSELQKMIQYYRSNFSERDGGVKCTYKPVYVLARLY
ncbi:MAG: methyltransferase domain-containing protein [Armatimonadota bacterium]|nr:methyltransferase domain-containing protein [Armatimonadota bacterium]